MTVTNGAAAQLDFNLVKQSVQFWSEQKDYNINDNIAAGYYDVDDIGPLFKKIKQSHSGLVEIFTLGDTTSGKPIHGAIITSQPAADAQEEDGKVRVAMFGGLNGDEPVGTELLLRFYRHLAEGEHDFNCTHMIHIVNQLSFTCN